MPGSFRWRNIPSGSGSQRDLSMGLDRIVVPLDGSATAEAVLPDVLRLMERPGVELALVHVAPSLDPLGFSPTAQQAKAYLREVQRRLAAAGVVARAVLMAGAPGPAILRRADKEDADLIGLTTLGHGGHNGLPVGRVAAQLLRRCRVPLLVRRPLPPGTAGDGPPAERPIRNVLLPLDGSDRALQALPTAVDFCRRHAARLFVLRVVDRAEAPGPAQAFLRDVEMQIQDQGVALTTAILGEGDAAEEILDVVGFHLVDLIVLSTHGHRGPNRPLVGRVAEAILRRAPVPLVMVRSAEGVDPPPADRPAALSDAPSSALLPKARAASSC